MVTSIGGFGMARQDIALIHIIGHFEIDTVNKIIGRFINLIG
jgi:hypothetical protein